MSYYNKTGHQIEIIGVIALMFGKFNKPLIMGILNITQDSFSDGGKFSSVDAALSRARLMIEQGADMIDIGGESTRPGAQPVAAEQQIERVMPVIRELTKIYGNDLQISIDTTQSSVAAAAIQVGARIINDVSAGRDDPAMFALAAEKKVQLILMHMQGRPENMQDNPYYESVTDEVLEFLLQRVQAAVNAGVAKDNIAIDPGIGFGKRKQDNIDLLAHLHRFVETGHPVLLGTSRKRFMGAICNVSDPAELVAATAVTTALGVMAGVQMFRVHDIKENRQAADVAWAIRQAG